MTADLADRLEAHNSGKVSHTSKFKPWIIETAIAFREKAKATAFERYLKSGSGREFARRHFLFPSAVRAKAPALNPSFACLGRGIRRYVDALQTPRTGDFFRGFFKHERNGNTSDDGQCAD